MNTLNRLLSGRSPVRLRPRTPVLINTFAQFFSNCDLPLMVFPKDFPKDSKIRVQNFHIYALSLVMNELLKVRDIQARLGIGRSAVYALIHEPSFPAPIAINSRILRWEVTEFEQWLLSRKSSLKTKKQKQISPKGKVFVINGVRFRKGE